MQPFDWNLCRLNAPRLLLRFVLPYYKRMEIDRKLSNDNELGLMSIRTVARQVSIRTRHPS